MSITVEQTRAIIERAVSSTPQDTNLVELLTSAKQRGIDISEVLNIARIVGDVVQSKGSNETTIIATMIDAFKSGVYQKLVNSGTRYQDGRHDAYANAWAKVVAIVKAVQANNSGGGGISILGNNGGGVSLGLSGGGGIPVNNASLAIDGVGVQADTSAGLSVLTSSLPGQDATPAPVQPIVQQATPAQQVASVAVNNPMPFHQPSAPDANINSPILNLMQEYKMEDYAAHELVTELSHVSKTAKEANADVKQYVETADWREPLAAIFDNNEDCVYYTGADILVRMDEQTQSYMVAVDDSDQDVVKGFSESHRAAIKELESLQNIDDVEDVMKRVVSVINKMKTAALELHARINAGKFSTVTTAAETARFVNSYLYMIDVLVHNGISLATDRCKSLPTGERLQLERNADDLNYFAEDMYNSTVGANGFSSEADWFRDLFLTVGVSLGKLWVASQANGAVLAMVHTTANIIVPGNYTSMEKDKHISVHSLGATSEAVTEIYEEFYKRSPHAQVILHLPRSAVGVRTTYMLLSNGETTSPIHY